MRYIDPNQPESKVQFKAQYENFIDGKWVAPIKGEYFDNISPVDGKLLTLIPTNATGTALTYDATNAQQVGGWKCGGTGTTILAKYLPGSCRG